MSHQQPHDGSSGHQSPYTTHPSLAGAQSASSPQGWSDSQMSNPAHVSSLHGAPAPPGYAQYQGVAQNPQQHFQASSATHAHSGGGQHHTAGHPRTPYGSTGNIAPDGSHSMGAGTYPMSPYGAVGYGQAPGPGYQTSTSNTAYYGGTGGYYAGDPMQAAYAAGTSASTYSSSPYRAGSSAAMQPRGTTTAHDPYRQPSHQQAASGGTANVAPGGSSQYTGGASMDRGMYYSTSGSESAPESARRRRRSSAAVPDHQASLALRSIYRLW
ncbi:hypothetical protein K466DRAFT_567995 [Polyporus arcularius HHB13444]|uniref:Uncharacterized protein n=1 Tax=Polyporus arcularius HHB13444 TaxID=1314778 RepID=A0A5C3P1Q7_9APHY|nr:hypothetical protein K466DRAFT_567995 [Polyporus arcularius HHB13444]